MTIYALVDPRDNSVRYIGRTKDLDRRVKEHWRGRHSCLPTAPYKNAWLLDLEACGLEPRAVPLDENVEADRAWAEESRWIARWWRAQAGMLVNDKNDIIMSLNCNP